MLKKVDGNWEINKNGLIIVGDTFKAESGFNYASGFRNFGTLKIVEDIACGTAIAFLCGVKVFDEHGVLIIDRKMPKGFHFEREAVRKIVLQELLKMLLEVNQTDKNFNKVDAEAKIDHFLKLAYYESSYSSVANWAKELGIFNN